MACGTKIVGILNVTPDSFSDGGKNFEVDAALQRCEQLIKDGASVIDVGAESTRPDATPISAEQEWKRLELVFDDLVKICYAAGAKISLDTRHAKIAQKAIEKSVDWINDVSGLEDKGMIDVLKKSDVKIVAMHSLGVPADKKNVLPEGCDVISEVEIWARNILQNLEDNNIDSSRVIIDPGVGFGKTAKQSFEILQNINKLNNLPCKILVGHSRKSFFDMFTELNFEERDVETVASSLFLAQNNVDYLRVHNVEHHRRALDIFEKLNHL